jgi:tRNA(Ile)-lysidine synthase
MDDWLLRLQHEAGGRGALAVAFSGGLDSTVLLHALAAIPALRARGLRALHVDHGLHPDSRSWALQCRALCESWRLPFDSLATEVRADGRGLEAAAREARYAALLAAMRPEETLVLAQHRDDQAETVLLRLLRGAGSAGLAAMRPLAARGDRPLWRPLLAVPRRALQAYAEAHRLAWIDDPANADPAHLRNHLRHAVLPLLRERWPQADAALAASAALLAEDAALVDELAATALAGARGADPRTLSIPALQALSAPLQRHVLRRWVAAAGLPSPPASILQRVLPEVVEAAGDRLPRLRWAGARITRYRDLLHCATDREPAASGWQQQWDGSAALLLPAGYGRLQFEPAPLVLEPMQVRPRRGGERIRLPGRRSGPLKQVLQALAIPPWERERLPLLLAADGELLAAGDLAISARLDALLERHASSLRWWPDAHD